MYDSSEIEVRVLPDTNSRYERNTGQFEPQYMWYDKNKQEDGVHKYNT